MNKSNFEETNSDHFSMETVDLDDIDKSILSELQKDGKLSLRDLSERIGKSVTAIKNHLDRLLEKKIIKDTIAVVDCCKIGYHEMLIISIRHNTRESIQKIFENLNAIEGINAIYQVTGQYPILCLAKCVSKMDQMNILEKIKGINGIEEVVTQVVMQRIKEDFRVKIP